MVGPVAAADRASGGADRVLLLLLRACRLCFLAPPLRQAAGSCWTWQQPRAARPPVAAAPGTAGCGPPPPGALRSRRAPPDHSPQGPGKPSAPRPTHVTASLTSPAPQASNAKFFVGGNWKCNGTHASVEKLVAELNAG